MTSPSHPASNQGRWSCLKAWIRFRMERESMCKRLDKTATVTPEIAAAAGEVDEAAVADGDAARETAHEHFQTLHSSPRRDFPADGRGLAGRRRGISTTARLRTTRSRLSNHSGCDLLSRRQSRSD